MIRFRLTLEILSPVHVGSGEQIDPVEYVVRDDYFHRIDIPTFLRDMPPVLRSEFDRAVNNPNPAAIRRLIDRNVDLSRHSLWKAGTSEEFVSIWKRNLENPRLRMEVILMTRSQGTWQSYIPGSSIKGAIRTAVVSSRAQKVPGQSKPDPENFEKDVLRYKDAREDPFRCLRITDAYLPDLATLVDLVKIYKPGQGQGRDPGGIKMFYEQCYSMLDDERIYAKADLFIDDRLATATACGKRAVSLQLSNQQIIQACKEFYLPKLQEEHAKFYSKTPNLDKANRPLLEVEFGENEFPLRIGRFSHIECVTVDKYRRPGGRAQRIGWGRTRTLSGGLFAMGWVKARLDRI